MNPDAPMTVTSKAERRARDAAKAAGDSGATATFAPPPPPIPRQRPAPGSGSLTAVASPAYQDPTKADEVTDGIIAECHACGHGANNHLGEFQVAGHQAELLDAGKLICPKCGHIDVGRVVIDERITRRMAEQDLQRVNELLRAEKARLRSEMDERTRAAALLQPPPAHLQAEVDETPPVRGQHKS